MLFAHSHLSIAIQSCFTSTSLKYLIRKQKRRDGQLHQMDQAGTRQLLTADLWDRKLLERIHNSTPPFICSHHLEHPSYHRCGKKTADIIACDITHLNCFITFCIAETGQGKSAQNVQPVGCAFCVVFECALGDLWMISECALSCIQLLEYIIPPLSVRARNKKSGWRYLGNEKSYQRSAGVKTTGKNLSMKKKHLKKPRKSRITSKCRWQLGSRLWKGETLPLGRTLCLSLQKFKNTNKYQHTNKYKIQINTKYK